MISRDNNVNDTIQTDIDPIIKNKDELLSHGNVSGRKKCLEIIEAALKAVDPYPATCRTIKLNGDLLTIDGKSYDLNQIKNVYIIGGGKATFRQALAIDEILGDRITEGLVVVKHGQGSPLNHIRIIESAHPVPDENSFIGAEEILKIARKANHDDLVIVLISGGVSSNCCCPIDGISREDKIEMNRLLVQCGAEVTEIMAVRGHLSKIKGGRLAMEILPASCVTLTVSDTIGDPLEWNASWTHPDSSTFQDAVDILHRYGLWEKIPNRVRHFFSEYSEEYETPKSQPSGNFQYCMTVKTADLWKAAYQKSEEMGYTPFLMATELKGESREVGRVIAAMAREINKSGLGIKSPCAIIAVGETSVRIDGTPKGLGGANQELGCGASLDLQQDEPIVIGAIDTDGTDGPTDYGGALTDGHSVIRAKKQGLDIHRELMEHNCTELLKQIGDIIYTGHTGSNVNDLVVCLVD
jgi:glycerate 2-kinase